MTDTQALNHLIFAAKTMLQAGCEFAQRDAPEAFADACRKVGRDVTPRLEITLSNPVTVRAVVVGDDGEDIVQLFEITAKFNRIGAADGAGVH
jgi:hypothetical protein